jgi:hypothetical protein
MPRYALHLRGRSTEGVVAVAEGEAQSGLDLVLEEAGTTGHCDLSDREMATFPLEITGKHSRPPVYWRFG